MRKITYTSSVGILCVVHPTRNTIGETLTTDEEIEQRAWGKLPADAVNPQYVDASAIPSDRTFRNAWVQRGNAVEHDLVKAKAIAHEKRRARREILFAPHDAVIMKQIPGKDAAAAEQARADVRLADSLVQETIESATNVQQLKDALVAYGAIA